MKYTKEERMDIGRQIYNNELTRYEATQRYGISDGCARDYMRLYRDANGLRGKAPGKKAGEAIIIQKNPRYAEFEAMTREELIGEIIKARISEARAKKGYQVKGDGAEKVFEPIEKRNIK